MLLTNHCGISSYLLNSAVVHAVSTGTATGPYVQRETVLPPFAHEPDVVRAPDGDLVLITVAGDLGGFRSCRCSDGITSGCNVCNNSCHPQTPTVSVASSPDGPWVSRPVGPDWHGENPSIWITKNGTLLGMSRGGHISAYAANWSGTWSHALPGAGPTQAQLPTRPDAECATRFRLDQPSLTVADMQTCLVVGIRSSGKTRTITGTPCCIIWRGHTCARGYCAKLACTGTRQTATIGSMEGALTQTMWRRLMVPRWYSTEGSGRTSCLPKERASLWHSRTRVS